jgi:phosphoenolpyruvate-protein phosphotransferase
MVEIEQGAVLKGIPASPGIAIGPVYVFRKAKLDVPERRISDPQAEIRRLEGALEVADQQLEKLEAKTEAETGSEEAAIFEAHRLCLHDPSLMSSVHEKIQDEGVNAEAAWNAGIEGYAHRLDAMEDEYFRARAVDVRDVGRRVLRLLLGVGETDLSSLAQPSIVVARDLTPSDTARLNKSLVLGFCTAEGGPTSHTAIIARAIGVPAVVGAGEGVLKLESGVEAAVDGDEGRLTIRPGKDARDELLMRRERAQARAETALAAASEPAVSLDGVQVEIVANVGGVEDVESALEHGAEGIGLLRTEFLYLDRTSAPDESEQLKAYDAILDMMGERPVVVRTMDVGGDKELPYLDFGSEQNPFLGWRAIRMMLDRPELFKTQLRALLRASPGHDLRIMFPMVSTIAEVIRARELMQEAHREVAEAGHEVAADIQVGIMVEVPSVVVMAAEFAQEVDFFSIGTNDLTQYTMAADRTNEKIAYLGDACHPAILRQIQAVIEAAHTRGIWVGLCGELAGDRDAIPILLGLELDEFSMAPAFIPRAKEIVRQWSVSHAKSVALEALGLGRAEAVRDFIQSQEPA